ncbi:uncharacterized protein LOC125646004 isoform X2 [Ostrea edulis]|uniref:uncharacterized protein LOC125646004 isoform X2 n=1 Tax=Ostrea edulis TaxID=37623 RepID=UPI00209592FC|nr:uncharacterized protein LOC125646004 isoform X2 [Ostrea edulis]
MNKHKGAIVVSVVLGFIVYLSLISRENETFKVFYEPILKGPGVLKRLMASVAINLTQNIVGKKDVFVEYTSNFTIVTAYWNLGTFQKGAGGNLHFSTNTYFAWAKTFKYLINPLVVYTDSKEFKNLMEKLRADHINTTKIYFMNRTELWPFQLIDQIQTVYDLPGYPKFHPNTVNPGYAAAQHTKYAVTADTVRRKVFRAPFYAWLDIGYFRDIVNRNVSFELNIPTGFDPKRLAVNRIDTLSMNIDPISIFRNNIVWVGGGMFIGSETVILEFEQLYRKAVLYFLREKLSNSDQQVLYSLYSKKGREALDPHIELQLYNPKGAGNPWFYLGYLCRKEIPRQKP